MEETREPETIEEAIEIYAKASEKEKLCKNVKKAMRDLVEKRLSELGTDRLELKTGTVGLSQSSEKEVFDEQAWFAFLKSDLSLAKAEAEIEKAKSRFTRKELRNGSIYIKPKRG